MDVLHHDEQLVTVLDYVQGLGNVWVHDSGSHPGFVHEHRAKIRLPGELRVQAFDCDRAREADLTVQARQMDCRHSAGRDHVEQLISSRQDRGLGRAAKAH